MSSSTTHVLDYLGACFCLSLVSQFCFFLIFRCFDTRFRLSQIAVDFLPVKVILHSGLVSEIYF